MDTHGSIDSVTCRRPPIKGRSVHLDLQSVRLDLPSVRLVLQTEDPDLRSEDGARCVRVWTLSGRWTSVLPCEMDGNWTDDNRNCFGTKTT